MTRQAAQTYTYDLANRLATSTLNGETITYAYDGDGKRLSSTLGTSSSTNNFLWDITTNCPNWSRNPPARTRCAAATSTATT